MKDAIIGVNLIGGPKELDGHRQAYPADDMGGWPPPDLLAAFVFNGRVAIALVDNVPKDYLPRMTFYKKVEQSTLPEASDNVFRGATYIPVGE